MVETEHLLHIDDLQITYVDEEVPVRAVRGVSLHMFKGKNIGIMGESGCGKSTLALQILRLLDDKATTKGQIFYNGQDLITISESEIRSVRWDKIAISFQNSLEVLNPVIRIDQQLAEAVKAHASLSSKAVYEKVNQLLTMVELEEKWWDAYPHQLSGGMRQKVILALALVCDPEILILDEPTTALDVENKKNLIDLILHLQQEKNVTLITISHDVEIISRLSSELYVMYGGYIVESGPTKAILEEPLHPYTRGLLNSSPAFFQYKDLWGIRSALEQKEVNVNNACVFLARCSQGTMDCCPMPELKEVEPERFVACHKGGIEILMRACGVKKTYKNHRTSVQAVNNVNLEIKSGEVIALIGKSGSGKSTLAQLLVSLEKKDAGEILFRGKEIAGNWITRMQQGIQIVMQDPVSSTNPHMTILDVITEPLDINHIGNHEDNKNLAIRLMDMVQLPHDEGFLNRKCSTLSGGQRQRLAIARALSMNPQILIADEITAMLDPSTQANLLRQIKGIQNRFGFTLLFITHDLHMARKIADRVFVMSDGEIVECGMGSTIFDFPKHPVTKRLFDEFIVNDLIV